ncbi:SDR family NAD(P)-dependent oxidoreductase [Teredinibacter sp. KSP-S5-2]|uniref:SDR family NAD(P)-dependent oxidoreductase n=1 Tax=Teredinibacter sp. KSP-S5-2 TaxID=3034506 RepID=UPI002934A4E6|nr:SDR family NAD(P)-dependent oxidoreductase [Teredinibacter sp. KSP-S5-2]WNO08461.1 SDR family NAD(P)-dependent oxidoreductase [Teredinibacter sp. KSP-S5-2]
METIWITGASSGLGKALSIALAEQGYSVIASARNASTLFELSNNHSGIYPLPVDVTKDDEMHAITAEIKKLSPALDRVILNAGTCEYMDFPSPNWRSIRKVMETNFFGAVNTVEAALPLLKNRPNRGHIIGIGSLVTAADFPKSEAYGASKAALHYFLRSLRLDLYQEGIDVTEVYPGFIDTPLTQRNNFSMPFLMDANTAAKRIIQHTFSRPDTYIFPKRLALLLKLTHLFPNMWRKQVIGDSTRNKEERP